MVKYELYCPHQETCRGYNSWINKKLEEGPIKQGGENMIVYENNSFKCKTKKPCSYLFELNHQAMANMTYTKSIIKDMQN